MTRKTKYTDTDILNKKIHLVQTYFSFKEIYLMDSATEAAHLGMPF